MNPRKILVTSALPYANGSIHLGHLVEYIQTDIWVRFQKMQGNICYYVCADDTHGTPIMLRAEKEGITPEHLIDRVWHEHKADFDSFLVAFDNYGSTNSGETKQYAEDIYRKLDRAGLIAKRSIEQFFDPVKNLFLPDRFIKGECPKCRAKDQYGDNCEVCGADLLAHRPDRTRTPRSPARSRNCANPTTISSSSPTALPGLPRVGSRSATLHRRFATSWQEWLAEGENTRRTGTSRATRLISASRSPTRRASISTYGWMRRSATWAASRTCATRKGLDFDDYWDKDSGSQHRDVPLHRQGHPYFHALFWPAMLQHAGFRTPPGCSRTAS